MEELTNKENTAVKDHIYNMINFKNLVGMAVLIFVALPGVLLSCERPETPVVPTGNFITSEQLLQAESEVGFFIDESIAYRVCLSQESSQLNLSTEFGKKHKQLNETLFDESYEDQKGVEQLYNLAKVMSSKKTN